MWSVLAILHILPDDFLLQAEAQLELDLAQGTCALQAETVTKLLTLKQVEDNSKAGDNTTILSDTMANLVPGYTGGEWSLFFANCQKPSVVSFNLNVAMYNMHNGQKDYLSVGEDMIPSVYLVSLSHFTSCFRKVTLQVKVCLTLSFPCQDRQPQGSLTFTILQQLACLSLAVALPALACCLRFANYYHESFAFKSHAP